MTMKLLIMIVFLSTVIQQIQTNTDYINATPLLNTVNNASIDLSSIGFDNTYNGFIISGFVYYINWDTCFEEESKYKLVCLASNNKIYNDEYRTVKSSISEYIICKGNEIYSTENKKTYNYFGCAIIERKNKKYITSSQTRISTGLRNMLNMNELKLYTYTNSYIGFIIGKMEYKNWDNCEKDYLSFHLECSLSSGRSEDDYHYSYAKIQVNCSGTMINETLDYVTFLKDYSYSCYLRNNHFIKFDYVTKYVIPSESSIDISSLKVINQKEYKTLSGTVYYNDFSLCSRKYIKLVCLLTVSYPKFSDFRDPNNKLFNAECSATYINLRINNTNANIISCAVVNESRQFVYTYDTFNPNFKPIVDLEDVKRETNRNKSYSHIEGSVHYKNWTKCENDSNNYYLKCYSSYIQPLKLYFYYEKSEDINCTGNKIDNVATGKGSDVYFACGIFNEGGLNVAYSIKKLDIKFDILFLFKMFGLSVAVNFGMIVCIAIIMLCVTIYKQNN